MKAITYQGLVDLYESVRTQAQEYDEDFIKNALNGEKGVDWDYGRGFGRDTKLAFPPRIMPKFESETAFVVDAGVNPIYGHVNQFYFIDVDGSEVIIAERGRGFYPGARYHVTTEGTITKAGSTSPEPTRHNLYPQIHLDKRRLNLDDKDREDLSQIIERFERALEKQ